MCNASKWAYINLTHADDFFLLHAPQCESALNGGTLFVKNIVTIRVRTEGLDGHAAVSPGDRWCRVTRHATFYQGIRRDGWMLVHRCVLELDILCKIIGNYRKHK